MSGYRERISKNIHFGREAHPVMRPDFKSGPMLKIIE
jgi:hypothetical protein